MTGLSRCGKKYATFDEAIRAAEALHYKGGKTREVVSCDIEGSHWHLKIRGTTLRSYHDSRPDPFPPVVAALLDKRDEVCQLGDNGPECAGRLERHHRRAKASGGSSARAHTQCACNGVKLCRKHHAWVHLNPTKAKAMGLIVLQSVSKPGSVGMHPAFFRFTYMTRPEYDRWLGDGGLKGVAVYPTCDGGWNDQP